MLQQVVTSYVYDECDLWADLCYVGEVQCATLTAKTISKGAAVTYGPSVLCPLAGNGYFVPNLAPIGRTLAPVSVSFATFAKPSRRSWSLVIA